MPPIKSLGERVADALIEDGLVPRTKVEELLEIQKKEGTRLIKLLTERALCNEIDLAVATGKVLNTPPVNLPRTGIPPEIAAQIGRAHV